MTDTNDQKLADLAKKENAKLATVRNDLLGKTCIDAGMPADLVDGWLATRADKFEIGEGGVLRNIKTQLPALEYLKTKEVIKRPSYFGTTAKAAEADALPSGAANPFSREGWNVTEQGKMAAARGVEATQAIAALVGSRIGATKPPVAAPVAAAPAFNASLGVKPTAADIAANPWLDDSAKGEARRIQIIKRSPSIAKSQAEQAGRDLAGRPLKVRA
jgi:hypothetical protein